MMKYPEIEQQTINNEQNSLHLTLFIPRDIAYFAGHFPETPVLPGVVQVDWAMYYAAQYLKIESSSFRGVKQLKFSQVILPESRVKLELIQKASQISFKYYSNDAVFSSGQMVVG